MSKHQSRERLPAPCIVDEGILIDQDDIRRVLTDLCHVRYTHTIAGKATGSGEGFIQEIFSNSHQSTLIANQKIYLNLHSFDYLRLSKITDDRTCFDLIQDDRQLRLIPISRTARPQAIAKNLDAETIEAMVAEVLSARLDVQIDDEDF